MPGERAKLAGEWFALAENDLEYAERTFRDYDDYYSQICVLCHQVAEKYLKGFLVYHGKRYSRVHDLSLLLKECSEVDREFERFTDDCKKITDYYILLRYPVTYPHRKKSDAKEAIDIAVDIQQFIMQRLTL